MLILYSLITSMEKSSQLAERLSYILGNIMNTWSYNVKFTLIEDFYTLTVNVDVTHKEFRFQNNTVSQRNDT